MGEKESMTSWKQGVEEDTGKIQDVKNKCIVLFILLYLLFQDFVLRQS